MVKELKDGTLEGLVWDFGYIDYLVATDCDLVKVRELHIHVNHRFWLNLVPHDYQLLYLRRVWLSK